MNFLQYLKKAADEISIGEDYWPDCPIDCPSKEMTDKAVCEMLRMADNDECEWCSKAQRTIGHTGQCCPTVADVYQILKKIRGG